jgi:hypothetical protein
VVEYVVFLPITLEQGRVFAINRAMSRDVAGWLRAESTDRLMLAMGASGWKCGEIGGGPKVAVIMTSIVADKMDGKADGGVTAPSIPATRQRVPGGGL